MTKLQKTRDLFKRDLIYCKVWFQFKGKRKNMTIENCSYTTARYLRWKYTEGPKQYGGNSLKEVRVYHKDFKNPIFKQTFK
jgi:hypothetical protein